MTAALSQSLPAGADIAALDAPMRPVDALGAAGLGALTTYVAPLQDVLDNLAGNAAVVRSFAETWQRTADALGEVQCQLGRTAPASTAEWLGDAGDRYRSRAANLTEALRGTAELSASVGKLATTMGETVAGARTAVNDLLADLVRRLISYVRQASAAEGGLTANVMAQATSLVDSYRQPIAAIERGVSQAVTAAQSGLAVEFATRWGELRAVFEKRREVSPLILAQAPAGPPDVTAPAGTDSGATRGLTKAEDHHRGGAYLSDGRLRLEPLDKSVPSVSVSNRMKASGFVVPADPAKRGTEHTYRVDTPTNLPFDQAKTAVGNAIAGNPVPTWGDVAATGEGVRNNAGGGNNVMTYRIESPDPKRYTDIIVNYTIAGEHVLHEGYVIRYGERNSDGTTTIVSYGEGNAWLQQEGSPANWVFDQAWKFNQDRIVNEVRHQLSRPR